MSLSRRFPTVRIGTFIGILHLLIGILGAGIISMFALYFIYRSGEQANLREVEDLAFIVGNALEDPYSTVMTAAGSVDEIEGTLKHYLRSRSDVRYDIICADGNPFLPPDSNRGIPYYDLNSPEFQAARENSLGQSIRWNMYGQRTIFVATRINSGVCAPYGILVLAAPFDEVMAPTYHIMRWMGVIAVLIVAFTVFEGWLGSIYISRPLARLSQVAESLREGNLNARATPEGPREVVHLARTLNEMAARLQDILLSMRAFVANASHELRTPLTSVKLQVDALRDGARDDPEVAERFLGQMDEEIDRLVHTVNDLLDLSRMDGGEMAPNFQAVDLVDLATEVQAFWEVRLRQARLTLTVSAESDLPQVKGDPYQLRRLFDNLVDNAIKNTPDDGKIEIVLHRHSSGDGSRPAGFVRVEFRDTGIGIAPENLTRIFDRFYRVDKHPLAARQQADRQQVKRQADDHRSAARPVGSGLGLAIARSITHAHSGQIGVNSVQGVGSTFWVDLPIFVQ